MIDATAPKSDPAELLKAASRSRLKKTCADFESLFITYMLKTMRSTAADEGIVGSSSEGKIIQSMFDENLARGIADGGGMGIAEILYQHLKDR